MQETKVRTSKHSSLNQFDDETRLVSYGRAKYLFKRLSAFVWVSLLIIYLSAPLMAAQDIVIAAFGDSLTAGYQLPLHETFPVQLERALRARGHKVRVLNAGVSGDTSEDAEARLDWALGENVDAVIVEFGANDALRGYPPSRPRKALGAILKRLAERKLGVLLAGMAAPRNMGPEYIAEFDSIYPDLAKAHKVILFPFFLKGVAAKRQYLFSDGLHPNAKGIALIVQNILPYVEKLISKKITE